MDEVIRFWFEETTPKHWWVKDPEFDQVICTRFGQTHHKALAGECFSWRDSALGRLAEILVLDQFSRNIYRNDPRAFAADGMALILAQEAVAQGADLDLEIRQRAFLYMPYMHSESLLIHQEAMKLYSAEGLEQNLQFEEKHLAVIQRFGRYPHRNEILGRASTPEEQAYLAEPGAGF